MTAMGHVPYNVNKVFAILSGGRIMVNIRFECYPSADGDKENTTVETPLTVQAHPPPPYREQTEHCYTDGMYIRVLLFE